MGHTKCNLQTNKSNKKIRLFVETYIKILLRFCDEKIRNRLEYDFNFNNELL